MLLTKVNYWLLNSTAEINEVLDSLEQRAQGTCDRRNNLLASWNAKNPASRSTLPPVNVKP